MKNVILISFIAVCSFALIEANIVDNTVYEAIRVYLKTQYPNDPEKVDCMIDHFRRKHLADKFYSIDVVINQDKLRHDIDPYINEANMTCTLLLFFQSPLGICVLVAMFLLALSIICCLIKCICC